MARKVFAMDWGQKQGGLRIVSSRLSNKIRCTDLHAFIITHHPILSQTGSDIQRVLQLIMTATSMLQTPAIMPFESYPPTDMFKPWQALASPDI
mmetsp:Transcript_20412/g.41677  ORF Transcript_20412/g.41677 Transcript_20412/m.41677 type:complete len:94 (+) Transcript_20412:190-471(+)